MTMLFDEYIENILISTKEVKLFDINLNKKLLWMDLWGCLYFERVLSRRYPFPRTKKSKFVKSSE